MSEYKDRIINFVYEGLTTAKPILPIDLISPQTFVSKAILESAVKQAIFLSILNRENEQVSSAEPLPLMMTPILVYLSIKSSRVSGNISLFGYSVELKDFDWEKDYSLEEFNEVITIINNMSSLPAIHRRD